MTPEQILGHPPKILTPEQRQSYFAKGYNSKRIGRYKKTCHTK